MASWRPDLLWAVIALALVGISILLIKIGSLRPEPIARIRAARDAL